MSPNQTGIDCRFIVLSWLLTIWVMSWEASVCPLTGSRVRPRSNTTNFCTALKYCSLSLVFSTSTSSWKLLLLCKTGQTLFTQTQKDIHQNCFISYFFHQTHISVANQLPLVAACCYDVALRHVKDAAFVGQVEICHTELTLKEDFHTSTCSRSRACFMRAFSSHNYKMTNLWNQDEDRGVPI